MVLAYLITTGHPECPRTKDRSKAETPGEGRGKLEDGIPADKVLHH